MMLDARNPCRYVLFAGLISAAAGWSLGFDGRFGANARADEQPTTEVTSPPADASPAGPSALVEQLGHADYAQREAAQRQLVARSAAARDALIAGLRHKDAEVRRRCRDALAVVLDQESRRRLAELRSAPADAPAPDLPGWKFYSDFVGAPRASRKLFADMLEAEPGLFESLEAGALHAVRLRAAEVFYFRSAVNPNEGPQPPSPMTLASLLLASSRSELDGAAWNNVWANLVNQLQHGPLAAGLKDGPDKEPLRALVEAWLGVPAPAQFENQKLRVAISLGFNDMAISKSLAVLSVPDKFSQNDVASALECVAILGGKEHAATIAAHLSDERSLSTRILPKNERQELQVRDVALALLLDLTGQDLNAYGFKQAKNWFDIVKRQQQNRGNLVFNFGNFFLDQGADRKAGLDRWAAWVAQNPLPKPPAPSKLTETMKQQAAGRPARPAAPAGGVAGAIGAARRPVAPAPADLPVTPGLQLADREIVSALKRVPALLADERYAEAVKILGDLLAADEDYCYRPESDGSLFRQVKAQAEQLLSTCPSAALDEYELNYGALARVGLERSMEAGDLRAMADVERRYFFTKAGAEAAFLLGSLHRTGGRFTSSALYFERLRRLSPAADRYEPALSVQLAFCWHRVGMTRRAEQTLADLRTRRPGAAFELAGQRHELPAEGTERWLTNLFGAAPHSEPQWSVFAGTPSGNSPVGDGPPLLQGDAWAGAASHPWLDERLATIAPEFLKERRTLLPTLRPLVAGDRIVVRTPLSIVCYDRESGRMLWESRNHTNLSALLASPDEKDRKDRAGSVALGLRRRLWEDLSYGALSTDGRHLFALVDPGLRLENVSKWLRVRDDGRREIDTTPFAGPSRLAAYDLATGKLLWERGGAAPAELTEPAPANSGAATDPLAGARFLGPSLPLGDQTYAVVELADQTLLVSLDVESGAVREQWLLDAAPDEPTNPNMNLAGSWPLESPPVRTTGVAYADGVVLCRTSRDRYVAFDLTQRSVRWSFRAPTSEPNSKQRAMRRMFGFARNQGVETGADAWSDAGAVIADGKVLIAGGDEDKLYCLNAADGALLWSVPRHDGLYVAGVADGRALVVGRSTVRAWKMTDGTPAWPRGAVNWPAGSTPSGRGYLSGRTLQVPLTTAEVASVDFQDGQLVARSRNRSQLTPGNLVQVDRHVFTWTTGGLRRFDTLAARSALLPAGDDLPAERRVERAELMLYEGKVAAAVELLQVLRRQAPSADVDRLLSEALLLSRPDELAALLPLAAELAASSPDAGVRSDLWRHIAALHRSAGRFEQALDACCRWIDSSADLRETIDLSVSRQARRSRLIMTEIAELWTAAPADVRPALDAIAVDRLAKATTAEQIDCFGFHPSANAARLRLAAAHLEAGRPLAAELAWRDVWSDGGAEQQVEAAYRLGELLRRQGQSLESARFFQVLNGPLADRPDREGRTGRQLAAGLPADSDVLRLLSAGDSFPSTKPKVESAAKTEQPPPDKTTLIYMPLRPSAEPSALAPRSFVAIDQRNRKLFGFDASGVRRWAVELPAPQNGNVLGLQNAGFAECRTLGHLVVAWLGSRLFAIDPWTDGGKVLWTRDLLGDDPNRWWQMGQFQRRMQIIGMGAQGPSELETHFIVTRRYIAFQVQKLLTAVDPLTGETLWLRDDLPPSCELFGDGERLIAAPPESNELRVIAAGDGRDLGRTTPPQQGRRLALDGTGVLYWHSDENGSRLERFEAATGDTVWKREFSKQAKVDAIDDRRLAVLEPDGRFWVLGSPDAAVLLETRLADTAEQLRQRKEALESVVVLANDRQYYVVANRVEPKSDAPIVFNRRQPGYLRVDGVFSAVDAATGKTLWHRTIEDQSMVVCHPTESPVFALLHRRQKATPVGNGGWTSGPPTIHLACLDRRTGEMLHQAEFKNGYDLSYQMSVDPGKREWAFQNAQQSVTITYPEK